MVWEGHPRTSTPAWRTTRLRILNRDGWTCTICGQPAREVDHIVNVAAGGTDDDSNLTSLCTPHHRAKTQQEAARARWPRKAARKPEAHPGMR